MEPWYLLKEVLSPTAIEFIFMGDILELCVLSNPTTRYRLSICKYISCKGYLRKRLKITKLHTLRWKKSLSLSFPQTYLFLQPDLQFKLSHYSDQQTACIKFVMRGWSLCRQIKSYITSSLTIWSAPHFYDH